MARTPSIQAAGEDAESETEEAHQDTSQASQTSIVNDTSTDPVMNGTHDMGINEPIKDVGARFEALVNNRDALRAEVTQLRQSLEELQAKHQTSLDAVREELQGTHAEKEHAEEQYQTLLGRVNTIKSQLGERLKADAVSGSPRRNIMHGSDSICRKTLHKPAPESKHWKSRTRPFKNAKPVELPSLRT